VTARAATRDAACVSRRRRRAAARARLRSKKGAIVDTAIIAGTMASKRTHELIPFCHPLPIEAARIGHRLARRATLRDRVHGARPRIAPAWRWRR
jgi:cyclic pyranopterin phosphate synthase